jgi:hypothetical protein
MCRNIWTSLPNLDQVGIYLITSIIGSKLLWRFLTIRFTYRSHIQTCHVLYFPLHNINSVTGRINIIVIVPSHLMSSILFLILVKYASRPSHLANLTNLPVSFLLPTSQPQTFISCSGLFISTLRLHRYCYKVSHLCSLQPSFRWLSHGHERQRPTTTKRRHISSHKEMRATQNIRHAFWAVGLDFAL